MKNDRDVKIVIIGFGFLMGYIYPCYEKFLTPDNLGTQIIAVNADEKSIDDLRRKYPFKIMLYDNLTALRNLRPDIILFAPPPSVAPMLAETVLKPYFDEERQSGRVLPDLYAFPPTPPGKHYLDLLGVDINVCNILPNMVKAINGKELNGAEGNSYMTYPNESPWPVENKERLERFFAPLGDVVDVKPQNILKVLSTLVANDVIPHMIYTLEDALIEAGHPVNCNDLSTLFRQCLHKLVRDLPKDTNKLSRKNIDPAISDFIFKYCKAWYQGLVDYLLDMGIDAIKIQKIVSRKLDLVLHACQEEPREVIEYNALKHATPDGVLEQGTFVYNVLMKDKVFDVAKNVMENRPDDGFYNWVGEMAIETCRIVTSKGARLAGDAPIEPFSPNTHALLFGLLVRNAVKICGHDASAVCEEGVKKYAVQRGGRMGLRAEKHGDERTMVNYMVYGEWKPIPGSMDIREFSQSPVAISRVYKCPWNETWSRYGFAEEGRLYCRHIDKYLVKGYNGTLKLGLNSIQMEGDEFCEFVWNGADLNEKNKKYISDKKEKLGDSCIMDWEYHCMHLFKTMSDEISENLENGGEAVVKTLSDFTKIFGKQAVNVLLKADEIDFNVPDGYNKL